MRLCGCLRFRVRRRVCEGGRRQLCASARLHSLLDWCCASVEDKMKEPMHSHRVTIFIRFTWRQGISVSMFVACSRVIVCAVPFCTHIVSAQHYSMLRACAQRAITLWMRKVHASARQSTEPHALPKESSALTSACAVSCLSKRWCPRFAGASCLASACDMCCLIRCKKSDFVL